MENNDILRRLRYTFDLSDSSMISTFEAGNCLATRSQISDWLKKEDTEGFQNIADEDLAKFLNGFIITKRGKREGDEPIVEKTINNNQVFRKLRIALNLKEEDVLSLLSSVQIKISKHELSAFFRNPAHAHYRPCQDQILRNFLKALQLKYRPN